MTSLPREPTDRQLADIVHYVARLCLEAERGLRPPAQLEQFMDSTEALRSKYFLTLGRFDGGPIQPEDVGQAHICRQPDGSVIASIVTRTEGRRWGALSLKLRPQDGRWKIADVRRLLANKHLTRQLVQQTDLTIRALGHGRSR